VDKAEEGGKGGDRSPSPAPAVQQAEDITIDDSTLGEGDDDELASDSGTGYYQRLRAESQDRERHRVEKAMFGHGDNSEALEPCMYIEAVEATRLPSNGSREPDTYCCVSVLSMGSTPPEDLPLIGHSPKVASSRNFPDRAFPPFGLPEAFVEGSGF
jgi:hypothetical protein